MAILALIIATSLWGLNFHFAKLMLPEVDFIEGGFWRYLFGVLLLVLFNIINLPTLQDFKTHLKGVLMIGGVGLFGFNIFFFLGMDSTTGVNGALIMGLNPALTLIYSHFILNTAIHKNHIVGIFIALFGVFFLLFKGDLSQVLNLGFTLGDLIVLIAVNFFALHHVWVKKYSSPELPTGKYTLMAAFICLICLSLTVPFTETAPVAEHSMKFWIGAAGIGIFGSGISYLLWNKGVKELGANKAGVFVNLVPLSAGMSSTLFGETLESFHFISGAIIVCGLLIMQLGAIFPKLFKAN